MFQKMYSGKTRDIKNTEVQKEMTPTAELG